MIVVHCVLSQNYVGIQMDYFPFISMKILVNMKDLWCFYNIYFCKMEANTLRFKSCLGYFRAVIGAISSVSFKEFHGLNWCQGLWKNPL